MDFLVDIWIIPEIITDAIGGVLSIYGQLHGHFRLFQLLLQLRISG